MNASMQERRFGRCIVRTWRIDSDWHPYPWRFSVQEDGGPERHFYGIPNYCGSMRSALMRGFYRAKWINDGSYWTRYRAAENFRIVS